MFSRTPLQRSLLTWWADHIKLITWKRRWVASEWDRCCSEGPPPLGVTWYLCWLILSTTRHHLDPTVVNASTGVSRFSLTYFGLFSHACFCCSPLTLINSFFCDLLCLFVGGNKKWWWWWSWFTQGQRTCSLRIMSTNFAPKGNLTCKKCFPIISKHLECDHKLNFHPQIWDFSSTQLGFFIQTNGLHEFLTLM